MITTRAAAAKVARESRFGTAQSVIKARQELAFIKLSRAIDNDRSNDVHLTKKQVKYLINQLKGTLDD